MNTLYCLVWLLKIIRPSMTTKRTLFDKYKAEDQIAFMGYINF